MVDPGQRLSPISTATAPSGTFAMVGPAGEGEADTPPDPACDVAPTAPVGEPTSISGTWSSACDGDGATRTPPLDEASSGAIRDRSAEGAAACVLGPPGASTAEPPGRPDAPLKEGGAKGSSEPAEPCGDEGLAADPPFSEAASAASPARPAPACAAAAASGET
jgi:hypothetical protein